MIATNGLTDTPIRPSQESKEWILEVEPGGTKVVVTLLEGGGAKLARVTPNGRETDVIYGHQGRPEAEPKS